ncbi:hypothetical protein AYM39_03300 [Methylomonas sp. DH-1]|nr:hypothetical protein AYM39_03300 [Methylomonas sp. DH-1]
MLEYLQPPHGELNQFVQWIGNAAGLFAPCVGKRVWILTQDLGTKYSGNDARGAEETSIKRVKNY